MLFGKNPYDLFDCKNSKELRSFLFSIRWSIKESNEVKEINESCQLAADMTESWLHKYIEATKNVDPTKAESNQLRTLRYALSDIRKQALKRKRQIEKQNEPL